MSRQDTPSSGCDKTITPHPSDDDMIDSELAVMKKDRDREPSQITQLSPQDLLHASNPNVVLTNPVILSHLQRLHDRATQRRNTSAPEEDEKECREQLQLKISDYNKQMKKGAFRVTLHEDLSYSGPLIFHYKKVGEAEEISRLMSLKNKDTIKDIASTLREKFEVSEGVKLTVRQHINGDEILLDPEDRPLELAVNANSSVTFNIVAGSDRTAEVLRNLQTGSFTPLQRKKLMERFNIDDDTISSSDFGDHRTSQSSASESTGKCDSLEGSPITSDRNRNGIRPSLTTAKPQARPGDTQQRKTSSLKELEHLQNGREKSKKGDKISQLLGVTTTPRQPNGKASVKSAKRPQTLTHRRGREQTTVSASARKIFLSLRKSGRGGRSSSRERAEKQASAKAPTPTTPQDELSSDVHLPGILKIFGDAVSPGANYKSVLATRQSNARELVKAALERYGVPRSKGKLYVLCEVVGRVREEKKAAAVRAVGKEARGDFSVTVSHQNAENQTKKDPLDERFTEDYVRPLNDHEKPLILQSFWKPLEGYSRRFELRKRAEVLDQINNQKDTETKDVNAQAKRLIMQKTRLSRTKSSLSIKMSLPDTSSSDEEDEEGEDKKTVVSEGSSKEEAVVNATLPTPSEFADNEKPVNGHAGDTSPVPFLITLQGEDGISSGPGNEKGGNLIHYLETKVTVIGRTPIDPPGVGEPDSTKDINIRLSSDDIKPHHCVIYRRQEEEDSGEDSKESPWVVTLHPVTDDCVVAVNGLPVTSDKEVVNGDIVAIGSKYIFMLKDPSSKSNLTSNMRFGGGGGLNPNVNRLNSIASRGSAFTPVKKRFVESEVNYRVDYEDNVLDVIFAAANDIVATTSSKEHSENCHRELAPARFLCHCIEQACFNFTTEQKRSLLFVIATNLQTILLDATGSVSLQDDAKIKNPAEGINYILPKLEAVVFWMSNSLEIFSYLQSDLAERIKIRVAKELDLNEVDTNLLNEASGFRVSDDILAVLEEVVMYAFQQLVYYLTKTLYGALPTVLDTNPFAEIEDTPEGTVRGTGHVIAIYDAALGLTRKYGVHPAIETQLFAYLFFFTNVSLFNTIMEEESAPKYYRWEKGIQIRGNLEEIECWANDNGFQEQATEFLTKFSALTNLLATTKNHMLQHAWSNFRHDFPQLHPVQLRQILDNYVLGPRVKQRPTSWMPDPEDLEESTEEEFIQESYDNHPPLMLPTDGTQLDLNERPQDLWYTALRDVILAVGQGIDLGSAKPQDVWMKNGNNNNATVGVREQPDGREIPSSQLHAHSSLSSSSTSSLADRTHANPHLSDYRSSALTHSDIMEAVKLTARPPETSSATSMSSAVSDSTSQASYQDNYHHRTRHGVTNGQIASPTPAPRKTTPTTSPGHHKSEFGAKSAKKSHEKGSPARAHPVVVEYPVRDASVSSFQQTELNDDKKEFFVDDPLASFSSDGGDGSQISSTDSYVNVNDIGRYKPRGEADLRVLPVKSVQGPKFSGISASEDDEPIMLLQSPGMPKDGPQTMPNEVFIVDVVKGRKGLGLGLVDGMYTSLQVPGVFVRSLVPDGPHVKHVRMKHQEVIKCWLKEGRLQLGDRLLAVNGTSLISMNYASAMAELRQAGDKMRFLVGRSGPDVAVKITSSSC